MKRVLVCGAAILVLAGCGSSQSSTAGSADQPGPSASATASAATGKSASDSGSAKGEADPAASKAAKQPAKLTNCGLTERDIAYMQRDWERVVDSIGRGDHDKYTHAFVVRLDSLKEQGKDCAADQALSRFITAAERVDQAAKKPVDGYGMYRRAAETGNKWLDQVGIEPNELAAG